MYSWRFYEVVFFSSGSDCHSQGKHANGSTVAQSSRKQEKKSAEKNPKACIRELDYLFRHASLSIQ